MSLYLMILGAMVLALGGLAAFIWSLRSGQYDDPAGAAARVLLDHEPAKLITSFFAKVRIWTSSAKLPSLTAVPDDGP